MSKRTLFDFVTYHRYSSIEHSLQFSLKISVSLDRFFDFELSTSCCIFNLVHKSPFNSEEKICKIGNRDDFQSYRFSAVGVIAPIDTFVDLYG